MLKRALIFLTLLALVILVSAGFILEHANRTPRELAPYIERRASGHNPVIVGLGNWLGKTLRALDRMDAVVALPALSLGAQTGDWHNAHASQDADAGHLVLVGSAEQARLAIANANPGDVITFLPGVYQFSASNIIVNKAGRADAPMIVRAAVPGTVKVELALTEGFHVSAPYWIFENLHIRGVCQVQSNCEHAFHVVGNGHHFVARNNTIVDFNAHVKINKEGAYIPDDGVIEYNTISNTEVRRTEHSVTLIDLVAASRWRIEHNVITDFIKGGSDRISYGAFAKGGGKDNRIASNVIICEHRLRGNPGQRVGLSLGGGGTGKAYCPDQRCITEQDGGVIESNLVMACSDDGIYLNKAATSRIIKNTLIDTGGIEVRFAESTADVEANLVDGKIRARDGGLIRSRHNIDTNMLSLFLGHHPVRQLFRHPSEFDLRWSDKPKAVSIGASGSKDLCGIPSSTPAVAGAFDDFNACLPTSSAVPK